VYNGRVFHGLFVFSNFLALFCVACLVPRPFRALASLLAVFATAIDVWRFMRGVPRAFGRCSCGSDLLSGFTSRGRGVSDYMFGPWHWFPGSFAGVRCFLSRMLRACEVHE
jgi:hypothetical protein